MTCRALHLGKLLRSKKRSRILYLTSTLLEFLHQNIPHLNVLTTFSGLLPSDSLTLHVAKLSVEITDISILKVTGGLQSLGKYTTHNEHTCKLVYCVSTRFGS